MRLMMGILSANSLLYRIDTSTQDRYTEDRRYLERRPNMKRKILTLLLAVSLVNASVSPAAADDYTIEMQEDPEIQEYSESQDIVFDEPEYAGENSADETTAADFEEDVTEDITIEDFSDEAAAAGFEEEDIYNEDLSYEEKNAVDDIVVEDAFDTDLAGEDKTLTGTLDSYIGNEESAEEETNLAEGIPIDEAHFPDSEFRYCIKKEIDDGDGYLSEEERYKVESIDIEESDISSLAGIEYFENLRSLYCGKNELTSLDVTRCKALEFLYCDNNELTSLDVSQCTALQKLSCSRNQLTSLDVSQCTKLAELNCSDNQLTTLDVSKCKDYLTTFICDNNQLTSLDVSNFTKLIDISCCNNQLTSLDVELCVILEFLECETNQLTSLDVSWCYGLKYIDCSYNQLTSLDVSECDFLKSLYCNDNQLTSLNLSKCELLRFLDCYDNRMTNLDLSNTPKLKEVFLEGNKSVDDMTVYTLEKDDVKSRLEVDNTIRIIAYPEHEHIPQISIPAKVATCTKAGNTAEEKCSICGEILTAKKTIPALGHKWGKWTTTKAATTTAEGKETRTCTRCGVKKSRTIPKLEKKANPITVKSKNTSVKASKLTKKKQTIKTSDAFTIKNAQGTVTFKKKSGSSAKLSINSSTGLITVKKGTKKGTYKIVVAVTAAGNKQYKSGTKTVTVKVTVK